MTQAVTAVTGNRHSGATIAIIGRGEAGKNRLSHAGPTAAIIGINEELKNKIERRRKALEYDLTHVDSVNEWSDDDEDNEDNAAGASGVCASGGFGLKGPTVNSVATDDSSVGEGWRAFSEARALFKANIDNNDRKV